MKADLITKHLSDKSKYKSVSISLQIRDIEALAIDIIKRDTGVDLEYRLKCEVDPVTLFVTTVIDENKVTEEELDSLGIYSPYEHYLTTEAVLSSLLGITEDKFNLYADYDDYHSEKIKGKQLECSLKIYD